MVTGGSSLGVRRPDREADHLNPSRDKAKNAWNCTSTTSARLHRVVFGKAQGLHLPSSTGPCYYRRAEFISHSCNQTFLPKTLYHIFLKSGSLYSST